MKGLNDFEVFEVFDARGGIENLDEKFIYKNYPFAFIERDVSTVSVVESFVVEILMSTSTSHLCLRFYANHEAWMYLWIRIQSDAVRFILFLSYLEISSF